MVALVRVDAVYVTCRECGDFPVWAQVLLSLLAVALAWGLIFGFLHLVSLRTDRRDKRLRTCFLGVQRAWSASDPDALAPFTTSALEQQLREQLAGIARSGRVIHHERPRVQRLTVVQGGGKDDVECIARIQSSVRHWLAEAASGAVAGGSTETSHDDQLWRFVRDPARGWLAAEINASPARGGAERR